MPPISERIDVLFENIGVLNTIYVVHRDILMVKLYIICLEFRKGWMFCLKI